MSGNISERGAKLLLAQKVREQKMVDKMIRKEMGLIEFRGKDVTKSEMAMFIKNSNNFTKASSVKGGLASAAKRKRVIPEADIELDEVTGEVRAGKPFIPIIPNTELWNCNGSECNLIGLI